MSATSKGVGEPALLVLEDGTAFRGRSCGASGEVTGEVCFNTSLEGYLEVMTDPSYAGQIITMTYPQIGNYGVNREDIQRDRIFARGMVVRDMCATPSSWRSEVSLPDLLKEEGIVAIEGVDTRALVRHIRSQGAMMGILSTEDLDEDSLLRKVRAAQGLVGANLVAEVSESETRTFDHLPSSHSFAAADAAPVQWKVVAYDCGVKDSILQNLTRIGCEVTCVGWDTPAEEVLALNPDGVFLSNGPGDPQAVDATLREAE